MTPLAQSLRHFAEHPIRRPRDLLDGAVRQPDGLDPVAQGPGGDGDPSPPHSSQTVGPVAVPHRRALHSRHAGVEAHAMIDPAAVGADRIGDAWFRVYVASTRDSRMSRAAPWMRSPRRYFWRRGKRSSVGTSHSRKRYQDSRAGPVSRAPSRAVPPGEASFREPATINPPRGRRHRRHPDAAIIVETPDRIDQGASPLDPHKRQRRNDSRSERPGNPEPEADVPARGGGPRCGWRSGGSTVRCSRSRRATRGMNNPRRCSTHSHPSAPLRSSRASRPPPTPTRSRVRRAIQMRSPETNRRCHERYRPIGSTDSSADLGHSHGIRPPSDTESLGRPLGVTHRSRQ